MRTPWAGTFRRSLTVLLSSALGATLLATAPTTSAQAASTTTDGSSAATAAASCWEVKQQRPDAQSGTYWLQTPTMQAPQQFRCDMVTDGGGWVLVGRGREGWQAQQWGQGAASTLLGERTGFGTTQLPARTIDALLDGGDVSAMTDGIRLRRARNTTGTLWQEGRVRLAGRDRWSWSFGAGLPVASYSFDGISGSGGSTASFGRDSLYQRVDTSVSSAQGYTIGFAYGSNVAGSASATSFLWSRTDGLGSARPYTEVWLRPRLTQQDVHFDQVADAGTPTQENRPLVSTYGMSQTWGVTGLATSYGGEGNVEVQAFTESNGVVYVGGNFRWVQRGAAGEQIDQPYLAAFYRDTGEPVRGFAPRLNGQVKALATLPNGNVVAGGQFSQANGQPATGIVALDRSTGTTDTSFQVTLENRITNGAVLVRSLVRNDTSLFIGGALTHVSSRGSAASYQRGAAQVSAATGAPVTGWNPEFNGTVVAVDSTPDRLYAAGYFTTSRGQTAMKAAAVLRQPNSPLATPQWSPVWSSSERSNYQQAIRATDQRVWVGGSEHSMFAFDSSTFARTSTSIGQAGGDLQTISIADGVAYGGCHCNNFNYSDATTWPGLAGWTQADKIGWIGAWDARTGEFLADFSPIINSDKGAGSWSSMVDSKGTLWTGGDYVGVKTGSSSSSWAGGFVRFAASDTSAPAVPSGVVVAAPSGDQVRVAWRASAGAASYEVLRDDRVVAVTGSTAVDVPLGGDNRFFVRAVDASGNRSASSPVAEPAEAGRNPLVLPYGSQWAYRTDASAPAADWATAGFDDSSWRRGPAVLGFGSTDVVTNTDNPAGTTARAVTSYFRHTVTIPDVAQVKSLTLTTWADDGIALYVDGKEVGRKNLGSGSIAYSRYADAAPRTATARAEPLEVVLLDSQVPDSGPLTVAAEVHLNYRGTRDSSFDLRAVASYYTASDPKPAPAPDPAPEPDPEPEPDPVIDPDPVPDPEPDPQPEPAAGVVLAPGQEWAYRTEASAPAGAWAASTFDDSGWARGNAVLGFGSADLATNIDNPAGSSARAVTSYFRKTVELEQRDGLESLTLTTWADDGIAVYLNGVEVGRENLGTGSISYSRYADVAVRTSVARAAPLEITIPASELPDGPLTIAAEVHLNYRATRDASFDLEAGASYEGEL